MRALALIMAASLVGGMLPGAASAQAPAPAADTKPTSGTADDASIGVSSAPASTAATPVTRSPDAARKEGTAAGQAPKGPPAKP